MNRPKTIEGDRFKGVAEAVDWLDNHYYFYWRGAPKHHAWIQGLQTYLFIRLVRRGTLRKAMRYDDPTTPYRTGDDA